MNYIKLTGHLLLSSPGTIITLNPISTLVVSCKDNLNLEMLVAIFHFLGDEDNTEVSKTENGDLTSHTNHNSLIFYFKLDISHFQPKKKSLISKSYHISHLIPLSTLSLL